MRPQFSFALPRALVLATLGACGGTTETPDASGTTNPDADLATDASPACVEAGALDPSFGVGGITTPIFGSSARHAAATTVAIDPVTSRFLLGGSYRARDESFDQCAIVRLTLDGKRDADFANGGIALFRVEDHDCWIEDLKFQSNGQILAVGGVNNATTARMGIIRFDDNGAVDTTFGSAGIVISQPAPYGHGQALAIDAQSRIVLTAQTWDGIEPDARSYFTTQRYTPDGSLDLTFGVGGTAVSAFNNGWDLSFDTSLQSDGKIIVVGFADGPVTQKTRFGIVRYNEDGFLDSSFASMGTAAIDFGAGNGDAHGVVVDSMQRVLVAGGAGGGAGIRSGIVRLTSDGELDASFGTSGKVVSVAPEFKKLAIFSDDQKIIAVGWNSLGIVIARFNPDGTIDSGFGSNGIASASSSSQNTQAYDLAVQADGRIVAIGSRLDPPTDYMDFVAMRFCR